MLEKISFILSFSPLLVFVWIWYWVFTTRRKVKNEGYQVTFLDWIIFMLVPIVLTGLPILFDEFFDIPLY